MSDELLKNEGEDNETEAHSLRARVRSENEEGGGEDVEAHTTVRAGNDEDSDDVEAHRVRARVRAANDDDSDDVEAHRVRA